MLSGLREIGGHALRHTLAVQELLGQATIEMTMRYSHRSPDVGRSAVQMLDRHDNTVATQAVPEAKVPTLQ